MASSEPFLDEKNNGFQTNGLILSNTYLPQEIVIKILSYVNWKDLRPCRLVCHLWKELIDSAVCCEKLNEELHHSFDMIFSSPVAKLNFSSIPFYLYLVISEGGFGTNLLKNAFGSEDCPKFRYWNISASGGDGWRVETTPFGSDPLPEGLGGQSCFATSYSLCKKKQCIKLADYGLNSKVMDEVKPHIEICEWYAGRFDCGCIYKLKVSLLNSDMQPIDNFEKENIIHQWEGRDWKKISHTFKNYGPGVRYVLFNHRGKDTQFWAGHYGSKMAGGSVIAKIPTSLLEKDSGSS